ncbi:hypothetical protein [Paracraurococcus ruber]|uniref:hypothetical protein n=1 Tax=Paracraurococcus ruber TaxID=77675 RepID=UPI0010583452|nr:hypothetical protein [Paracraurococcus ruber]TDG28061.1 hypothetical protein E2C05_21520 [Paracraurococcus ruber]
MLRVVALALLGLVFGLALLSIVLGVPLYGAMLGHDADFAVNGVHMLSASWVAGEFWPRWMIDTNYGLGGTTYYSYPPMAHWSGAAMSRLLGLNAADAVSLTMALWRLLSVLTAWLWLRRHVPPGAALCGAAFAALLPYAALVNPWIRFAYAETAAAALLPLLLLAIERAADGRRSEGIAGLALAYAALALTNLPTCALAAHLGPLYALGYAGRRGLVRTILGGIAGALLAACFLVPAIGLLRYANAADVFNPLWRFNMLGYSAPSRYVLVVWGSGVLMAGLGAWLLPTAIGRGFGPPGGWPGRWQVLQRRGLPRALALLGAAGFLLSTVVALPLWWGLPQLSATEHPWRTYGHLVPVVAGLAALAVARGLRPGWLLAIGVPLALLPPAFLLARVSLGYQGWQHFLPSAERLAIAHEHYRAYSWEHLPAPAAAAGWATIAGGGAEPYARPEEPPGTERLTNGFRIPHAVAPFRLPQFWFPSWEARDALGEVPLRASPEGFLEVAANRPVNDLVVRIRPTLHERVGWLVTLATAAGLLLLRLQRAARAWRTAQPAGPVPSAEG